MFGVKDMKKALLAAILTAMLLALGTASAETALVNGDKVNLRGEPKRDARSLGGFLSGTQVEIVSDAGDGWSEIAIGGNGSGVSGYMMNEFLATGDAMRSVNDKTYDAQVVSPYGTQSIVLRSKPSDSFDAKAVLEVGESVRVIGESGAFYYVRTDDGDVGCLADDEVN